MNNLNLYNAVRYVPDEAKKTITAGRLKGMTDINPMWRIKTLTEQFGACGFGWYTEVTKQWIEDCGNEKVACVNINLYIKNGEEWSKPIFGTGGSKLSIVETKGVYVSDECFKMAYTDAISVACKSLGMGADVYWDKDRTKYTPQTKEQQEESQDFNKTAQVAKQLISEVKVKALIERCEKEGVPTDRIHTLYKVKRLAHLTEKQFANIHENWEKIKVMQ